MKNSVKKLIVSLMAIVMFAYVGIMVYSKQAPVDAVTVEFTATDVQDNYDVNNLATFPLSVDVSYNGATKTAENGILLYPSGKIVNITANPIEFTEQGEYKLRYFFMDGSVKVTAEKSFTVSNDLYYLTSNGGSVTPVTAEMNAAADMDTLDDNTMSTEKEGIIVRLAEGCMFKYNKPIDLSKCDENGLTNIIALDPRIYEIILSEDGSAFTNNGTIASEVKIKLTDCYNPGTFVEIILESSNTIYLRVGTNTQTSGGCKYPDDGKVSGTIKEYYVGTMRGICRLGSYGQWQHGYSGTRGTNSKPTGALTFLYDYASHKVWAYGGSKDPEDAVIVNDLMSSSIYGTNLFGGFTTGEVFLSIECASYNVAKQARLDIVSIGEDQGDYLVKSYSLDEDNSEYERYVDNVKPVVQFDNFNFDKVYCAVGDTFAIPSATAYDVNLVGGVETKVYRNYNSAKKVSVNIIDNAFKVDAVDTYYIEYTATDKYGNVCKQLFKVYGVEDEGGRSLAVITNPLANIEAGANTTLPAFTVKTVNDPAAVKLDIIATSDKETITIGSYVGLDAINEAGANGVKFMAKYAGEYTISFILKDSVYDTSENPYEYKVTSVASSAVSFLEAPFLERYLIKDAYYGLREFNAYEFTTGAPVAQDVEAYIAFDGGEFELIEDTNCVYITGNKTAQIKYVAANGTEVKSNVVKIADVNYKDPESDDLGYTIKMNKYFQYEEGAFYVEETEGGWDKTDILYESQITSGSNKLEFINSIFYDSFLFEYKIAPEYSYFDSFTIFLTDVNDPTIKTTITIGKNANKSYISINGGTKYAYDKGFGATSFNTVAYDPMSKRVLLGKTLVDAEINMPSGRCYLDVVFNNINGKAGMLIRTLNNQKLLGDAHEDPNVPDIRVNKTSGNYTIGTVVTVEAPEYADILSPIDLTSITYSVMFGDNYVESTDGVLLDGSNNPFVDVQVKLDMLGEYAVIYSAQDIMGNYVSGRYYFNVVDVIAPTINVSNFEEGYIYNVKLGQKITIEYEVSDNITPSEECRVAVMVTNMVSYSVTYWNRSDQEEGFELGKSTFFITEEGLHRVTVYCRDDAGNYVTKTFNMMVKA